MFDKVYNIITPIWDLIIHLTYIPLLKKKCLTNDPKYPKWPVGMWFVLLFLFFFNSLPFTPCTRPNHWPKPVECYEIIRVLFANIYYTLYGTIYNYIRKQLVQCLCVDIKTIRLRKRSLNMRCYLFTIIISNLSICQNN